MSPATRYLGFVFVVRGIIVKVKGNAGIGNKTKHRPLRTKNYIQSRPTVDISSKQISRNVTNSPGFMWPDFNRRTKDAAKIFMDTRDVPPNMFPPRKIPSYMLRLAMTFGFVDFCERVRYQVFNITKVFYKSARKSVDKVIIFPRCFCTTRILRGRIISVF